MKFFIFFLLFGSFIKTATGQLLEDKILFNKYDTLRGSITKYRQGWNVLKYELNIEPEISQKFIKGSAKMYFLANAPLDTIQIDLQQPLIMDSILDNENKHVSFVRDNNICLITYKNSLSEVFLKPGFHLLTFYYHGRPVEARKAPWDGGLIWTPDKLGRPWVGTACQGLGASAWWPCKDHQSDEPDSGVIIRIVAPDTLSCISNGRLVNVKMLPENRKEWSWRVANPINIYNVTMNIGKYVSWSDTMMGEAGKLDLQYWVLDYNLDTAKKHFDQGKPSIKNLEYWFGKYPFYEDGYKLIETSFLGMEHQSGIAYGNKFGNGYSGKDLSKTGWGLHWDFIITHESAHEWFGNNITANDIADLWIHEAFANYAETLVTQYFSGYNAAAAYCFGIRKKIKNDKAIIGYYNVNNEGSGDMYYKGGNLLHIIRNTINNDEIFRKILRGLNHDFFHSQVSSQQIEEYVSKKSGINFYPVFDQYLRTTRIPILEYKMNKGKTHIQLRWQNVIDGFQLPLILPDRNGFQIFNVSSKWKKFNISSQQLIINFSKLAEQRYLIQCCHVPSK